MPSVASGSNAFDVITALVILVGARLIEIDLRVECRFTDADDVTARCGDLARERERFVVESSGATTRLISPHASAVGASIGSPVSSISIARLRPIARVSATIGVLQKSPMRTPGVANVASVDATARSQAATS